MRDLAAEVGRLSFVRTDPFADESPEMRRWLNRHRALAVCFLLGGLVLAIVGIVFAGLHTLYFMPGWLRVFLPTFIPAVLIIWGIQVWMRTDPVHAPRNIRALASEDAAPGPPAP
jgi:hypothetical protein